jgi:N utilization substance protein B
MAKGETRSAARLAAVQALYQMDIAGAALPDVLAEFESHWLGKTVDGDEYKPAEAAFFRDLVGGVLKQQRALDPMIDKTLSGGWPLKRVEAIMRAIFRAGAFELGKRRDVPVRVVITEYVDIAHAFFDKDEAGMVNAVLDAIAREVRADEFAKGA